MRRLGRVVGASGFILCLGCSFDSQGQPGEGAGLGELDEDDEGPGGSGPPGDTSVPEPEPEPEPGDDGNPPGPDPDDDGGGTGGRDTDDPSSTDGHDDGDGDGDGGESEGDCTEPFAEIYWAEDAALESPMELMTATSAEGEPKFAASGEENEGTVSFSVELPCTGDFYVWGLVWDLYPGAYAWGDPDSYYVELDGPEMTWRYGCQTGDLSRAVSWQRVQSLTEQPCDVEEVTLAVDEEGELVLRFRNREGGWGSEVAAIGAVVVSTDPDFDPYTLYEPYE